MSLLALDGVSKRFGGITAVDQVSFQVDRGQVVGFLGPNGAGKSTTMRMITQFIEPDTGSIKLDGVPLDDAGREAKRRLGYLPENNPLYIEMLVSEYLDFVGRLRELPAAERRSAVDEAVAGTGLEPVFHRPIGELSKGFRQRVGLAAAILHRPDLLILDEPTEGLDPNQRVEIRHLIGNLEAEPLENGEVQARTAFLVYRSHLETDHQLLSGYREDVLRRVDGGWKVARRTIVLDANVLLDKNLSVFL